MSDRSPYPKLASETSPFPQTVKSPVTLILLLPPGTVTTKQPDNIFIVQPAPHDRPVVNYFKIAFLFYDF